MNNFLVFIVSIFSILQIGCAVEFEDPNNGGEVTTTSTQSLSIPEGVYLSEISCQNDLYKTATIEKLYMEVRVKNEELGLSSLFMPSLGMDMFVIDKSKQAQNMSVASFAQTSQFQTFEESKQLCESGVEITESSNSLQMIKSGHIESDHLNTTGFAVSIRATDSRAYKMTIQTSEYMCINSQVINVKNISQEVKLFKVDQGLLSSIEDVREMYDNLCN